MVGICAGFRPWVTLARAVPFWVRRGCCLPHHGRSPVTPQGAPCDFGFGRLSSPWSPGIVPASGGTLLWPRFRGFADRRGPAVGGRTCCGGSAVDCMGGPWRGAALVGSARGLYVPLASGVPGSSGTVGAGVQWSCLGLLVLGDWGSGSSGYGACYGPLRCGGPPCGATASVVSPGVLGYRPPCAP